MFNFKKLKSNFNIGSNVFNNTFKQTSPLTNSNIVHKKVLYYDKKGNAPPVQFVKQVYSKLPDDEKVPVEFMTKKQYLQQYIRNQEVKDGIRFNKQEKQQYIRTELKDMKPIVSRFTTYHNPYMPPKVVFFTDSKINKQQFKHNVQHEFGHELYERVPKVRQQWNFTINKQSSPTSYGRTSVDEDFAESYALYKDKQLQDSRRQEVFNNIKVDQNSKNSQIYLGKNKIGNKTTAYVLDNKPNKIFIGREAKDIDFNNDANLNHLSGIIGHEELHNVLINDVNSNTSGKLDNISSKTIFVHGKNQPTILAHIGNTPKEIIFPSEREKYVPVITPQHKIWLDENNQIVKIDKISKNHLLKKEGIESGGYGKDIYKYSTPEGVRVEFVTNRQNTLDKYPSIDDVGYMLDTLPPGALPSNSIVRFTPRQYERKAQFGTYKQTVPPRTYANAGREYENGEIKHIIRVFPSTDKPEKAKQYLYEQYMREAKRMLMQDEKGERKDIISVFPSTDKPEEQLMRKMRDAKLNMDSDIKPAAREFAEKEYNRIKEVEDKDKFNKFREGFIHELGHVNDNEHNIGSEFRIEGLSHKSSISDYGRKNQMEDVAESFVHYNKVGGYFGRKLYDTDFNTINIAPRMDIFEQKVPHTQLQSNPNVREIVENSLQSQTIKSHPTLTRSYEDLEDDAKQKQHTYSPEELPFVD